MKISVINVQFCKEAAAAADIMTRRLTHRGICLGEGYPVSFVFHPMDGALCRVGATESGAEILADTVFGFVAGAGVFLRSLTYTPDGAQVRSFSEDVIPACEYRGIYFASHFMNWYVTAPEDELREYVEDMGLLGINWLCFCYPSIDLPAMNCPEADAATARLVKLVGFAHAIGIKVTTGGFNNSAYRDFPKHLRAAKHYDPLRRRGNHGNMMCFAKEEARLLVDECNRDLFGRFKECGLDMISAWPYDEGGCGCEQCAPWGAKGYIASSKRMFTIAREYFPNAKFYVSTWLFDTPDEGEWDALSRSLEEEKWCDMILADSHGDFPRYPLDQGVPGGLPMICFPEISMWGLWPWGGWGATALPQRFARIWSQMEGKASGGFAYSEGIFEDINKVVISAFYSSGKPEYKQALEGYARYELGMEDTEEFLRLVELMEKIHTDAVTGRCSIEDCDAQLALAERIDAKLPAWSKNCWRWRQIYLRAVIDARKYRHFYAEDATGKTQKELLRDDPVIRAAFDEIYEINHNVDYLEDDILLRRVRPILPRQK